MKGDKILQAIVGGIVAGVAFGAGFKLAGKGMEKLGKEGRKVEDEIAEEIIATKPMELPAGEMSNLTGKGLVHDGGWSNAYGMNFGKVIKSHYPCEKDGANFLTTDKAACKAVGGNPART